MWDLLLKNGIVITMDGERRIYDRGYVAVEGDTIAAVGPMEQLPLQAQAAREIDCSGHAVLPGLVDGHGHGGHCLTRTLGEHLDEDWEPMAQEIYYRCVDREFWRAEGAWAGDGLSSDRTGCQTAQRPPSPRDLHCGAGAYGPPAG